MPLLSLPLVPSAEGRMVSLVVPARSGRSHGRCGLAVEEQGPLIEIDPDVDERDGKFVGDVFEVVADRNSAVLRHCRNAGRR